MTLETLLPLTALLALTAACGQSDDPLIIITEIEEPEEPELPEDPAWPEEPEWPEEPSTPEEPEPQDDPTAVPLHIAEGNYAWTIEKTVDQSVTDCQLGVDSLRDLAWVEGQSDGAWMNLVEADDDPTGYTVRCDREGDELVCEEFATELAGFSVRNFLQVEPADDGRVAMLGVQLTEVDFGEAGTCQIVYDVEMVRTPTQALDAMSCASESFLTAQSSGASSLVWIDANPDHDLEVFALDQDGTRLHARTLQRNYGGAVAVTGGTPLVVTRADTGACLDVYLTEDGLHHTGSPND